MKPKVILTGIFALSLIGCANKPSEVFFSEDYDQRIARLTEAIAQNPESPFNYSYRGDAYYRKGEYDLAIRDYTKAIELNPAIAEAYTNRGKAYYAKGLHIQAIQDWEEAVRLDPNDQAAQHALHSARGM
ncbi:MAG: tetratricopeptide repeat protein [Spirochaetaceae bacterium]|nr:tetratricopeptide repeat protein [Spirochaetaceae bacterium]